MGFSEDFYVIYIRRHIKVCNKNIVFEKQSNLLEPTTDGAKKMVRELANELLHLEEEILYAS